MQHNYAVLQTFFSFTAVTIAAVTDVRKGLIYNWLTIPALLLGFVLSAWYQGWAGLGLSTLGMIIGGGVLFVPFFYNAMGGGDVKLMAAIGAIMGPKFAIESLLASILVGGVVGFAVMLIRGKIKPTFAWYGKVSVNFMRSIMYRGVIFNLPPSPKVGTFPFGVSILAGVLITYHFDFLHWFLL